MKTEILRLLRETDGYISGQELCDKFQVSRTAVWKVMNQLKEEGYEIEAVRNKGYTIVSSPDVMSKKEIESLMQTEFMGRNVVYYDETDSTNTRIKRLAEEGAPDGTLVVADKQVAGKGRRGRAWESPSGEAVFMSILLKPEMLPIKAPMLTLLFAYSTACAIREKEELNVRIKWPNDIVLHKKKVCGILTEMSTEIDYINYVVIGIGINVNNQTFPEDLKDKATSLGLEKKERVMRSELIAAIMMQFEEHYALFLKTQDLSGIQQGYNSLLVNADERVKVLEPGNEYEAHAEGINELGELVVRKDDGTIENVFAGEVSVRGIYGYV